ncbi:uncharacterized protein RAG0_06474 [Rhynchosporium agropyri]|uniref:Uncharacterized protein n=1 Tax=Rhynchosporium agropyri TaxID=914238 RepID=A0A1E1KKI5_9HELO|nr:uncharacterized protein RAG0_06474 [Rhynchosporium agropyri]
MLFYKFSTSSEVRNGLRICYRPRYDPWSYISYTQYGEANQICLRRSKYVPELSLAFLSLIFNGVSPVTQSFDVRQDQDNLTAA